MSKEEVETSLWGERKLNYRFHNPNPVEVTAEYILKVMIEANAEKVEKV